MAITVIPVGGTSKPMTIKAKDAQKVSWDGTKQKTAQTSWTANKKCTIIAAMVIDGWTGYFTDKRRSFTINGVEFSGTYILSASREYVACTEVNKGDTISLLYEANCGSSGGTIRTEIYANS